MNWSDIAVFSLQPKQLLTETSEVSVHSQNSSTDPHFDNKTEEPELRCAWKEDGLVWPGCHPGTRERRHNRSEISNYGISFIENTFTCHLTREVNRRKLELYFFMKPQWMRVAKNAIWHIKDM